MRDWLGHPLNGPAEKEPGHLSLPGLFSRSPVLEGQRVRLRLPVMQDAHDLFAYARDPEVARFVLWDAHTTLSDSKDALRSMIRRNRRGTPDSFVIELKAENRMVGTIGFQAFDPQNRRAEVGYSLAHRLWGHGLATEALKLLCAYAFDTLGMVRLEARHASANAASGRVLEKAGFQKEGVEKQSVLLKGERVDMVWYAILHTDKTMTQEE